MSFLTGVDRFLTVAKSSFENIKKYSTGEKKKIHKSLPGRQLQSQSILLGVLTSDKSDKSVVSV